MTDLIKKAVLNVFARYYDPGEFDDVLLAFENSLVVETGGEVPSSVYQGKVPALGNMAEMVRRVEPSYDAAAVASAIEFALEGLHLNRRLNRDLVDGKYVYRS